ncbi:hypothetical protein OAG85_01075 [Verrucomicrobiales bacterium]|nr:hypothetical protein [Verrucomicrobiales bacterium]MDB4808501.1 hypothetical protein [Verrucomicrobiales bacterium]
MKWTPQGGCKEIADGFHHLAYLTVDSNGNILITEQGRNLVHRISPDGSYFLDTHKGGDVIFVDRKGIANIFIHGSGRGNVWKGGGEQVTSPGEKISEP